MWFRSIAAAAALCCCVPPVFAQSLTRVQILGLQQQLRDDGCGVSHVTGRMDAMTRRAVQNCMHKYNVSSGGAPALLAAMNIGLGSGDALPSLSMARGQGNMQGGVGGQVQLPSDSTGMTGNRGRGMAHRRARRRARGNMQGGNGGGNMPSDSVRRMRRNMGGDSTRGRMRDTTGGSGRGRMRDSMGRDSTTMPPGNSPTGTPPTGTPPGTQTP